VQSAIVDGSNAVDNGVRADERIDGSTSQKSKACVMDDSDGIEEESSGDERSERESDERDGVDKESGGVYRMGGMAWGE
jgi:hypothetical protein